jgi:Kef-type K+ transport system membrane component KefB
MFDEIVEFMTHLPLLARFAIALLLFISIPPLCKRIRLPAAVGLLLAGGGAGA